MVKYDFNRRSLLLKQYLKWLPAKLGLINKGAFTLQIDEIRKTDIFFASYPKSGNTWLRYIVATAIHGSSNMRIENLKEYVPDVYIHKTKINTSRGQRFIKTHHPLFAYYPRTIYIYRNVFDTMVSFYYHVINKKMFQGSVAEFIRSGYNQKDFGTWASSLQGALDAQQKGADILMVKYEDLLTNPEPQIASLLAYTNIKSELTPLQIAEMTHFDHLKALENKFGSFFSTGEKFFREGKQNNHPELSEKDKETILSSENTRALMIKFGYL